MHILFSTGKTAGEDTPSESSAMRDYLHRLFPGIPAEAVFLEEDSIDTAGNAEKVAEWLQGKKYGRKALVSVGYHADNAATLFENYGVPIEKTYASEEVVRERSNHHAAYVMGWQGLKRVRSEYRKELVRKALLHTVDPRGKLLRRVTERSRK
jgi:uncharacterized SAM-binding protein YcdF (DUF218 family)